MRTFCDHLRDIQEEDPHLEIGWVFSEAVAEMQKDKQRRRNWLRGPCNISVFSGHLRDIQEKEPHLEIGRVLSTAMQAVAKRFKGIDRRCSWLLDPIAAQHHW